jgi:hypothetical protein
VVACKLKWLKYQTTTRNSCPHMNAELSLVSTKHSLIHNSQIRCIWTSINMCVYSFTNITNIYIYIYLNYWVMHPVARVSIHLLHTEVSIYTVYWYIYIFVFMCGSHSRVYSACNRNEYRKISWGKARPACKVDSLTTICGPIDWTTCDPRHQTTL